MNKKFLIGIGIFWVAIFTAFIGVKEFTLRTGEEVVLKTVPVDPWDIFRGEYVTLRYEISEIETTNEDSEIKAGDQVKVLLSDPDGQGYTSSIGLLEGEDELGSDELFINGRVTRVNYAQADGPIFYLTDEIESFTVEYGIESYFVEQGSAGEIEEAARAGEIEVVVAVDRFGNAVIKELRF